MNSFYIDAPGAAGAQARLTDADARHARSVLRLRADDEVYVCDPEGRRFSARIFAISAEGCDVLLGEALPDNEAPVRITLYQGLPKADKLDWIVQKLTELGADCVCPVNMARCVVKPDAKDAEKRRERLDKIAREAAKQCKRAHAPEVLPPMSWKAIEPRLRAHALLLVPWEDARGFGLKDAHALCPDARDIGIVIGPEGGMSAQEVAALEALGARAVTLGPRILRTETAALTACALAGLLWGDLG